MHTMGLQAIKAMAQNGILMASKNTASPSGIDVASAFVNNINI